MFYSKYIVILLMITIIILGSTEIMAQNKPPDPGWVKYTLEVDCDHSDLADEVTKVLLITFNTKNKRVKESIIADEDDNPKDDEVYLFKYVWLDPNACTAEWWEFAGAGYYTLLDTIMRPSDGFDSKKNRIPDSISIYNFTDDAFAIDKLHLKITKPSYNIWGNWNSNLVSEITWEHDNLVRRGAWFGGEKEGAWCISQDSNDANGAWKDVVGQDGCYSGLNFSLWGGSLYDGTDEAGKYSNYKVSPCNDISIRTSGNQWLDCEYDIAVYKWGHVFSRKVAKVNKAYQPVKTN